MNLVIVESPTKAKTIHKYLGKEFVVKSSFGHVRDLPTGASKIKLKPGTKKTLLDVMGVDPFHEWEARYEILPGKDKIVKELKEQAKKADAVYLAADPDREGEAIAWHLKEILKSENKVFHRVVYHEITKRAIQEAFSHPGVINQNRVNAQQARRFLDRVVGFKLSPLLWKTVARGLSAGRVQSVAVRILVEREREIKAFVPEEYWTVLTHLFPKGKESDIFQAEPSYFRGEKITLTNKEQAETVKNALESASYKVSDVQEKPASSKPLAPFITSTLQQSASVKLGFGVARTMRLAQRLYESGHITYMRTDSTKLAPDAVHAIRAFIQKQFSERYLPAEERHYASKALAQEAHEAIRPSEITLTPETLSAEDDEKKLYELIWRQTLASQMTDAEFDTTSVTIQAGNYELRARGRVLKFDGWQKVIPLKTKESDLSALPPLSQGQELSLQKVIANQHFTKPPARYSEASLVKELEKQGIGRPSTYATILSTIQDRGYARLQSKRFYAEKIGEIVTDQLSSKFSDLMDYQFTALLEEDLDKIASSELDWKTVLDRFYIEFHKKCEAAEKAHSSSNPPVMTKVLCKQCGRPMQLRVGRTGIFLGCSGYALLKDQKCSFTQNLMKVDDIVSVGTNQQNEEENGNTNELLQKKRCGTCGTAMDAWLLDEKTQIHVCGRSPYCDGTELESGLFQLKTMTGTSVLCDKCEKPMILKEGRFGKYFSCTGAPECKNIRKVLRSGQVAPPKAYPILLEHIPCIKCKSSMILRDGASGLFLACSAFPKCRNTMNVSIKLLRTLKNKLDPKFHPLTEAPATCPNCQGDVILRWSRKVKKNFFTCENSIEKKCTWIQGLPQDTMQENTVTTE